MLIAPADTAVIVNEIVAVASVTPVPRARIVTVTGVAPVRAAVLATASATLLAVAPLLSVAGVNVAVTPVGRFSAVRFTSPEKFVRPIVMTEVPLAACTTAKVVVAAVTVIAGVTGGAMISFFALHAVINTAQAARAKRESERVIE